MNNTLSYYNKLVEQLNLELETLAVLTAQFANLIEKNPYLVDDMQSLSKLRESIYILTPVRRNTDFEVAEIGWIKEVCLSRGLSYEALVSRRIELIKTYQEELREGKELLVKILCGLLDGLKEQETRYRGKLSHYRNTDGELHFIMSLTPEGKEAAGKYIKMRKYAAGLLTYLDWMKQSSIYEMIKSPVFEGDETELKYARFFLHRAKELRIKTYQFDIF